MVVEARNSIIGVKDYCILAVMPLLVLMGCKQNMDQSPTKVTGDEQIQITMEEVQQAVSYRGTHGRLMCGPAYLLAFQWTYPEQIRIHR